MTFWKRRLMLITDAVREIANADIGFSNGFRFGGPSHPQSPRPTLEPAAHGRPNEDGVITGQQLMAYLSENWNSCDLGPVEAQRRLGCSRPPE
jgi:hypothetical protein